MPPDPKSWLSFNRAELPPRAASALLDHFGSPAALLAAPRSARLEVTRLTPTQLERLDLARSLDLSADLAKLEKLGARLITSGDFEYPANLRQIPDPPPLLFCRGKLEGADERAVAIVGSRNASPYGKVVTESLARDLARSGLTIISGLARGIDAAAHRGALAGGGRTIAVLACGLDVPYPKDTLELREQIVEHGAVLSELPLGTHADRSRFPVRNRLLSGLGRGVIVAEARERSGALITARLAAEQGREVFAIPGSVNSAYSRGCHQLIKDGAKLVQSVEDVLEELHLPAAPAPPAPAAPAAAEPGPALSTEEGRLLNLLSLQQKYVDQIIQESKLSPAKVNSTLTLLQLKGLVERLPGNIFIRVR
jgi:DNA processing protein